MPDHCDRVPMTGILGQSTYRMILITQAEVTFQFDEYKSVIAALQQTSLEIPLTFVTFTKSRRKKKNVPIFVQVQRSRLASTHK